MSSRMIRSQNSQLQEDHSVSIKCSDLLKKMVYQLEGGASSVINNHSEESKSLDSLNDQKWILPSLVDMKSNNNIQKRH